MFLFFAINSLFFAVNSRNDLYRSWPDVTFLSLFFGVLAASGNGGFDAIKHLTLRFLLRRQNLIPRDLVAFLEHATKLVFLRKIGPGYIFIHRLLLENFAGIQPSFETTPMVSGDERRAERLPEETRRVAERQEAPLSSSTRSLAEECFVEGERYRKVKDYGKAREWYQKAADAGLAQAKQALSLLRLKRLFGFWSLRRRPRSGRR